MYESNERIGLYAIGKLSKMAAVSVDTLRYYEEIGLFKPAYTDRDSGYRYYTSGQAAGLARILELKEYGFSLKEIKVLLAADNKALMTAYQNRYWKLQQENSKTRETIQKLSEKIRQSQEELLMSKKILLVDDANFMRMMCKDILSRAGYEICGEAADGVEAVEKYRQLKPDLVLMDIVMPQMDGIFAYQKIKEADANAAVIMLSAMGQTRIVTESFMSGAKDFIVKPFQPQTLEDAVLVSFAAQASLEKRSNYNQEVLKQIHDRCTDDTIILSQNEINEIKRAALKESIDKYEIESLVEKLNRKSPELQPEHLIDNDTGNGNAFGNFVKALTDEQTAPNQDRTSRDLGEALDMLAKLIAEKNKGIFGADEKILPMLNKIVQGQEDIKELLQKVITKK